MTKQIFVLTMIIMFSLGAKMAHAQGGCWVKRNNMSEARGVMPAVLLNDTIYAIGGSLSAYASTSGVEAYNTTTDSWTFKEDLPQKLCGATAGAVNGKIYVIGGSTSILGTGYNVDSVYEYNPVSNSWTRRSNIPTPIAYAAADVVDGKIYVIGGCPFGFNSAYKSVYEYNPATDTWKKKTDMPTARFLASATAVDGKIYVFGGMPNLTGVGFTALEVYDPSADAWAAKGPMPTPRCAHASSAVDGNIFIFGGGERMGSVYSDVREYNPTLDTWATRTSIPTPRVGPAACSVGGKIYLIGGMDIENSRLSILEEYDPALDITSVGESDDVSLPEEFSLSQNYPNPFNPLTIIQYTEGGTRGQGPGVSDVSLVVYDMLGREVAVLVNERKAPGRYELTFDGSGLSSGVYIYRLKADSFIQTRKMLLLK
jgi:N-acetylneuraminic acid mutarotase